MKSIIMAILLALTAIGCTSKKAEEDPNVFYTCSMDPQVMEKKPGNCPICKMELTKTVVSPDQDKESIKLSETQIKLGNIVTQKVGNASLGEGLSLRGAIVTDERKTNTITSRVPGRLDKLYFKNVGQEIHVGDKVYEIYSEELQGAIKQYLLLKEKTKQINGANINYSEMLKVAKDKLHVWGMSESQIANINHSNSSALVPFYSKVNGVVSNLPLEEGDYVNEGSQILEVADYTSLWVEAEVYPQDRKMIKPGVKVNVQVEAYPNELIEGQISFENPELEDESRVNLVRIEISNKDKKYKPGMRVTVKALLKETTAISVPEEAVLFQPDMNMVWVEKEKGVFVPRMVETGIMSNGNIEIKSGLKEGEMVVVSGAYLIDSEYRLRSGTGSMTGMDHSHNVKEDKSMAPSHQH